MAQGKGKGETSYMLNVVWLQLNKDTDWLANHQQPLVAREKVQSKSCALMLKLTAVGRGLQCCCYSMVMESQPIRVESWRGDPIRY